MNLEPDQNVVTLVSALDEAGMFVVFATRAHRVNQGPATRRRQCLCHVFHAAGMCDSHELFVEMQKVLGSERVGGFMPAERGSRWNPGCRASTRRLARRHTYRCRHLLIE